jgi:hypothetical protein
MVTATEQAEGRREGMKDQRVLNGIEAQTAVVKAGPAFWREVRDWGEARGLLTPMESDIIGLAGSIPVKLPSEKQSLRALDTLHRLRGEGFLGGKDLP